MTLNIPRENLPQIRDKKLFQEWLTKKNVQYTFLDVYPLKDLIPTQMDFDLAKVDKFSKNPEKICKNPLVVANDKHILDGHHRWAGMLKADREATMPVVVVNVPIAALIGLGHQYVQENPDLNNQVKTPVKESIDDQFEKFLVETNLKVSKDLNPDKDDYGDPGYVLRRLKKVPIHTQNVKVPVHTQKTTIGTTYDKIKATPNFQEADQGPGWENYDTDLTGGLGTTAGGGYGYGLSEDEIPTNPVLAKWATSTTTHSQFAQAYGTKGRQRLMETIAMLAERMAMNEVRRPLDVIKAFDKTRVAVGKKPIFHNRPKTEKPAPRGLFSTPHPDEKKIEEASNEAPGIVHLSQEERETMVPTKTANEIKNIRFAHRMGQLSWAEAHKELLHRGVSVGDIPKHLGEEPVTESAKVNKIMQKTKKKKPDDPDAVEITKDKVEFDPTYDPIVANSSGI